MVEYTAPVFWLFLLLTGVSLFILRRTASAGHAFRVPLYPVTPLVFCATSGYLLYASLAYTGVGAFAGMAVLAAGGIILAGLSVLRETGSRATE
jgi:basic amino acid/polyamine antiporter, APA family